MEMAYDLDVFYGLLRNDKDPPELCWPDLDGGVPDCRESTWGGRPRLRELDPTALATRSSYW